VPKTKKGLSKINREVPEVQKKTYETNTELITKFLHCKTIRDLKNSDQWKNLENERDHRDNVLNIVKYAFNEVDIMHQWAVEWSKVGKKLVRGLDRYHKFRSVEIMQNDENHEVSKMAQANDWIKKHHFRAYT